ncbi:MAG: IS110 family transposase [Thermoplasmata archaeon]|nr:IS110 family transposase [Thermoplasmata archaeon]
MTNGYYVGMDVHQRTTSLCLMDGEGTVVREWKVRTAPKELDELHRELRRLCGDTPVTLGLEASTAGKATFQHLRKLGRNVAMAHPRALRAVTTSETKTDSNDARTLAHLLRLSFFPRSYVPEEPIERLRTLVRLREEQVDKLRRAKIQVRTLLVKHQLQHESLKYDDIFGVQALHWLKGVDLPDPYAQRQLVLLLEEGALYARQVDELTRELAKFGADEKTVAILQSVPGIDYVLALTILAEVGDVHRFPNRRKFAAYCGLVPKNRDSGEVVGRHSKLRHGSSRLKWALMVAVQAIRKSGKGRFAILLRRLEKRIGTPKALAAVAHRLAFTVYGLWKTETLYDEISAQQYAWKRRRLRRHAAEAPAAPRPVEAVERMLKQIGAMGVGS